MIVTMIVVLCVQLPMVMEWIEECQECHLVVIIYHHLHVLEQQCVTLIMFLHVVHHYQVAVHREYFNNNHLYYINKVIKHKINIFLIAHPMDMMTFLGTLMMIAGKLLIYS